MCCLPRSVLQEAVSTRDPELVRLVLRYRDYQRTAKRLAGIPILLERLRQVGVHARIVTRTHTPRKKKNSPRHKRDIHKNVSHIRRVRNGFSVYIFIFRRECFRLLFDAIYFHKGDENQSVFL